MPYLSSLDNLLQDAYIIFPEGVDNFEIEYITCCLVRGAVLLRTSLSDTCQEKCII